jgi:hypothetical protein
MTPITKDQARRIAANIAKRPELLRKPQRPLSTHFRYDLNFGHFAGLRSPTSWANCDIAAYATAKGWCSLIMALRAGGIQYDLVTGLRVTAAVGNISGSRARTRRRRGES